MTPANAPARAWVVVMGVGVLDETFCVHFHAFGLQAHALEARDFWRHGLADAAFCANDAMPRQGSGFLFGQRAEDEGDVQRGDVHVRGEGAVGGEFSGGDERDEPDNFSADAGKGLGFWLRHGGSIDEREFVQVEDHATRIREAVLPGEGDERT